MRGHLVRIVAGVAAFFAVSAHAGFASYARPSGVTVSGSSVLYSKTASNAPFVNGTAAGGVTVSVGGRPVTVPAAFRVAANASSYVVPLIRLNPTALALGAAATWLAGYSLQYINGEWRKVTNGSEVWSGSVCGNQPSKQAWMNCIVGYVSNNGWTSFTNFRFRIVSETSTSVYGYVIGDHNSGVKDAQVGTGTYTGNRVSFTPGTNAAAVEADFAAPSAAPLPSDVANQVAQSHAVPVTFAQNPDANGNPQPYRAIASSPYAVPGSSPTTYRQDVVDLKPAATAADPFQYEYASGVIDLGTNQAGVLDGTPTSVQTPLDKVEVRTCGLPDTAACKIDESGTPQAQPADQSSVNQAETSLLGQITGLQSKPAPTWTFSFALPTGCSVIQLPAFAPFLTGVDVCQWQPMIHDLMSMLWVGFTAFGIIGMVSRTLMGEGG